jgi:large subunit ribosomal protein L30
MGSLTVVQRRSANGCNQRQLDTLRSLGLRRIGHSVEVGDSPQARGMLHAVRHLVEVSGSNAAAGGRPAPRAKSTATAGEDSR